MLNLYSLHTMRTNIDIDDSILEAAMSAGPFKTKKEAVHAGLKLLARQAAYREILKWRGKLKWEGDESIDWTVPPEPAVPAKSVGVRKKPELPEAVVAESSISKRPRPGARAKGAGAERTESSAVGASGKRLAGR